MVSRLVEGPAGLLHVDDGDDGGDGGDGRDGRSPVVFIHSFGGNAGHWSAQLAHIRPGRRAVALDLRGHGRSAPASGDYAIGSLAGDVAAVVDAFDLGKVVLVGHGMGGAVAIAYAGGRPDRTAGLLLVVPPGRIPPDQAKQIVTAMESDYETMSESYMSKLLAGARPEVKAQIKAEQTMPSEPGLGFITATQEFDALPALRAYPGPKLTVTGESGMPTDLHNLVPDLPRKVIAGTSHWLPMDEPDEFNGILDEFLATID
jgi:pimeloyl-ACP methyl ester carboxylesterase